MALKHFGNARSAAFQALTQLAQAKLENDRLKLGGPASLPVGGNLTSPFLALSMQFGVELEGWPLPHLKQLQNQMKAELDRVEKVYI